MSFVFLPIISEWIEDEARSFTRFETKRFTGKEQRSYFSVSFVPLACGPAVWPPHNTRTSMKKRDRGGSIRCQGGRSRTRSGSFLPCQRKQNTLANQPTFARVRALKSLGVM